MGDDGKIIYYDTFKESDKLEVHMRIHHMKQRIFEVVEKYKCDKLVMEQIYCHANPRGVITLGHLAGCLIDECITRNVEYEIILASQWRKVLDLNKGKREEQKRNAIEYCKKQFGIELSDKSDDCAEAICICYYAFLEKERM